MPHKTDAPSSSKPGYVGSYGEHRLLTDKDLAGFYSFARHLIDQDEHKNFLYVGLGRSPVVLMEFMRQFFGIEPVELPLSVSMENDNKAKVALSANMQGYITKYLPPQITAGKTVVLIDYVDTGDSLVIAYELVQEYLRKIGQETEAKRVVMAPIGALHKDWNDSLKDELINYGKKDKVITQDYNYRTRVAYHMIKVLHLQIDKEKFSAFPRVRFTDIHPDRAPDRNPLVQKRLHDVVKLAIDSIAGDSRDAQALQLAAKKWMTLKTHSPREPLVPWFNTSTPRAYMRDQYSERLGAKSAKYYDIYSGKTSFMAVKLARSVWQNPVVGVLLLLMICALIYSFLPSSSPSIEETS
jgi:hypoxanthine phosphoribosyltransferase